MRTVRPVSDCLAGSLCDSLWSLASERPVFHSEADFQHALAWALHGALPPVRIRLEPRPEPGMHLDLLATDRQTGESLAVELKYLTAAWTGIVDGEEFRLLNHGAQDIRAYDVVKDIYRVERFVTGKREMSGAVIVLSNDPNYWRRRTHGRATNADAFRLYERNVLEGERAWGPLTGAGTSKGRIDPLPLHGRYECRWHDYSRPDDSPRGLFRALWFDIAGFAAR